MKLSDIDIRHLRVFLAVVECGGFSAAEGMLGLSQSTISTHIAELERRLGYRVCERGRAGFAVTEQGRELHASTLKLVDAFAEFEDMAASLRGATAGRCRIAVIDNLITDPRCPIVDGLKTLSHFKRTPRVNLDILAPGEIEAAVSAGRADLGISIVDRQLPGLAYTPLYTERDVLVCAADHPLAIARDEAEIRERVAAAPKVVRPFLHQQDLFLIGDRMESVAGIVTSVEAAAYLILAGLHIGFLPDHYARSWIEAGAMRVILPEVYARSSDIVLVEARVARRSPGIERIRKVLLEAAPAQSDAPMIVSTGRAGTAPLPSAH